MVINKFHASLLVFFFVFSFLETPAFAYEGLVYLGAHNHGPEPTLADIARAEDSHLEFLASYVGSKEKAKEAMIYSHTKYINAFSATFTYDEINKLILENSSFVKLFDCDDVKLTTTRSWEFLGLEKNGEIPSYSIWNKTLGEDVIIGNIDSGAWPDSESFRDDGMGPIPSKWKGRCSDGDEKISCNRKLISLRKFPKENNTALDTADGHGHGTHTLSIAGGRSVAFTNSFGYATGTAKGGAPNARVASYKCGFGKCGSCSFVAAIDEAMYDGVDVLSVSLSNSEVLYFSSLYAVKKGIVPVFSAGNNGPEPGTVQNRAPWVITVGGSSIDRRFSTYVELGNKQRIRGESLAVTDVLQKKSYPLVSYMDAKLSNATLKDVRECYGGTLDKGKVNGTIIVIDAPNPTPHACSTMALEAGAAGLIIVNDEICVLQKFNTNQHGIPTSVVSYSDGKAIFEYIRNTKSPTAYITPLTTEVNTKPAPSVGAYSSRGPNEYWPEILKPDVIAPGTLIVAALPPSAMPEDPKFKSPVNYYTKTGTSMSTPHVAGVAGLLKSLHPDWSPAMIKSAIMTTASTLDNTNEPIKDYTGKPATPFVMGAGHLQPNNAADPGLVYDLAFEDYLQFLCNDTKLNFTEAQLAQLSDKPFRCPKAYNLLDFNYPSITVPKLSGSVTVSRTVTNVGTPGTYKAIVTEPQGISLSVEPKSLRFGKMGEKMTFKLTLKAEKNVELNKYVFGRLIWSDGVHNVSSPIVVQSV